MTAHARPLAVYTLMVAVGAAAFLYPFWLPATALTSQAHNGDAPLIAALVGALVVAAVMLEVRRGTMNGAIIALLGMLAACAGLLRLIDLPGGGSGIFFLVVLAGAAFGPRFGLLLGLCSMAVSAIITGGIGPWLPFQMLALGWMGAGAGFLGLVTRRWDPRLEILALAAYGWVWGFLYGAIMNLWFWPFERGGALDWRPGLGLGRDPPPVLAVLRGDVTRVGRGRRDHQRDAHPGDRVRADAHAAPVRAPSRSRGRVRTGLSRLSSIVSRPRA